MTTEELIAEYLSKGGEIRRLPVGAKKTDRIPPKVQKQARLDNLIEMARKAIND